MSSAMVHIRLDSETKEQAQKTLGAMGLSMSDAVRIFFRRVIEDEALPFEVKVPNARLRAAIMEARQIAKQRRHVFTDAEALFADLDEKARVQ